MLAAWFGDQRMKRTRYACAADAVAALDLCEQNRELALYWLSLWGDDDLPPARGDFNPARVREHLPGVAVFERFADGNLICRLSGTALDKITGLQLTGRDMLSMLKENERPIRIERYTSMAQGTIAVGRVPFRTWAGKPGLIENVNLPFRGDSEQGTCQFLLHTNLRPQPEDLLHRPAEWNAGIPPEYCAIAFA